MKTTAIAVIAALLSFLIGNVWVLVSARMFVQYFYEARMVALTHVFTLGWVSLMIVGVLRQLAPVAFGLKISWPGALGVAVMLWIPGLSMMIAGFVTLSYRLAAIGTSVLFAAVVIVVVTLVLAFRGVHIEPPHTLLLAALLYFAAGGFIGAWMGLAKGFDVPLAAAFHRTLFAHIHLVGAGWAGMMILAVMSRLFPQPHLRHPIKAQIRFAAFNIGLIGLSAGLLLDGSWYLAFGCVLAIACIWYAMAFIPVLREFGQPSDRSTTFLVTSWSCLVIVALLGLWLSLSTSFNTRLQFVYGFIYMFGWLSFMILGMLYRIIPTHISKFLATRGVTSAGTIRRSFIDPNLQTFVWLFLLFGLLASSLGILTEHVALFTFGWSLWLTGVAGFVGGLVRVGTELRRLLL